MTQTLDRRALPRRPASSQRRSGSSLLRSGLTGASWAAGAGLVALAVPVLLVWAADARSGSGAAEALRTAAHVWLAAHGVSLAVPGGVLSLTPLGLLGIPLALLWRAGRHSARWVRVRRGRDAVLLTAALGTPYAVLVGAVAGVTHAGQVRPAPVQALLAGWLVGLVGAGAGVLRETGLAGRLVARVPGPARRPVVVAAGSLALLLGSAALLVAGSLAVHVQRTAELARVSGPGLVGGAFLLVLGLLLLPNAVLWAACWLAGPGFQIGVHTAVGPFGVALGAVPALPLLGALPSGPLPGGWAALVPAVPLLAAGLAGGWSGRARPGAALRAAGSAALAGPVAGGALGLLAWLSGGSAGAARLADVGPGGGWVALAVSVEVAVGAAAGAAVSSWRAGCRPQAGEPLQPRSAASAQASSG